jgi:S-(hydroxymethyl)glutathione dehydrogenase/alcohol dehydrogenase
MRTIKAAVADGKGDFCITELTLGQPSSDEVLVDIKAAGICHTDVDSVKGWQYPFVIGHEGAGIVSAVGIDVTSVKVGDAVMLNWAIPCGKCFQCKKGAEHICEVNSPVTGDGTSGHAQADSTQLNGKAIKRSFHLGTMSEATIVKEAAVVKITAQDMPFSSAAIVGCGVMTGYGSVVNAAKLTPNSTAVVIGCGGVGLNVIQGCKIAKASRIIAVDVSAEKAKLALSFGATDVVIAPKKDDGFLQVQKAVFKLLGHGADFAFECTAIPELGAAPLAMIRNGGTAIQASGIEQKVMFDCELFEWDKIYLNPLYGQCNPQKDFTTIQDLYCCGDLKLDELVSKTYSLENLAQGFDDLCQGRVSKGVVLMADFYHLQVALNNDRSF